MRSRPVPATARPRSASRGHAFKLKGGLYVRLEQERRDLIAAAPVTLMERDGRVFEVRHLPGQGA